MGEQLRDIREFGEDADAYRDELLRRWTGLLSYRYIGRNHSSMNVGETDDTVTIRRDMRNDAGGIMVAPLAIASPEGCQADLVAVPNPVIASVQIVDPGYDVNKVEVVDSGNVHQGRMMGYGRCKIVDAENPDRVIAFNEGQGAIIGIPPEGLEKMDVSGSELVIEDSPDLPPLWQAFGASKRRDGHWVLPALSLELASPDAALHIGPQHVVLETAAIDLAADAVGTNEASGGELARDVYGARQSRAVQGRWHRACRRVRQSRRAHAATRRGQWQQGRDVRRGDLGDHRLGTADRGTTARHLRDRQAPCGGGRDRPGWRKSRPGWRSAMRHSFSKPAGCGPVHV